MALRVLSIFDQIQKVVLIQVIYFIYFQTLDYQLQQTKSSILFSSSSVNLVAISSFFESMIFFFHIHTFFGIVAYGCQRWYLGIVISTINFLTFCPVIVILLLSFCLLFSIFRGPTKYRKRTAKDLQRTVKDLRRPQNNYLKACR